MVNHSRTSAKKKKFPNDYRDDELLEIADHYRISSQGFTRSQLIKKIIQFVKNKSSQRNPQLTTRKPSHFDTPNHRPRNTICQSNDTSHQSYSRLSHFVQVKESGLSEGTGKTNCPVGGKINVFPASDSHMVHIQASTEDSMKLSPENVLFMSSIPMPQISLSSSNSLSIDPLA